MRYLIVIAFPVLMQSCVSYYEVPCNSPTLVSERNDIEFTGNLSIDNSKEYGFKLTLMPVNHFFAQYNRQVGDFDDFQEMEEGVDRAMGYKYNELSAGFVLGRKQRFVGSLYYGFGKHTLLSSFPKYTYTTYYKDSTGQSARLQQLGIQLAGVFELSKGVKLCPSVRYHSMWLDNIHQWGQPPNKYFFSDKRSGNVLVPGVTLYIGNRSANFGISYFHNFSTDKALPEISPSTVSAHLLLKFNVGN